VEIDGDIPKVRKIYTFLRNIIIFIETWNITARDFFFVRTWSSEEKYQNLLLCM